MCVVCLCTSYATPRAQWLRTDEGHVHSDSRKDKHRISAKSKSMMPQPSNMLPGEPCSSSSHHARPPVHSHAQATTSNHYQLQLLLSATSAGQTDGPAPALTHACNIVRA